MTQPFHFPDGRVANNAQDLLELCKQYPDDATGFLVRQDLEKWLAYIGSHDIAECAVNARQVAVGDRQKLEDFLNKCHSLSSPTAIPPAVTELPQVDNLTSPESVSTVTETPQVAMAEVSPSEQLVDPAKSEPESLEVAKSATPPEGEAQVVKATPPIETSRPPQKVSAKTLVNSDSTNSQSKPSFFQVVAKFIVKILVRDKV